MTESQLTLGPPANECVMAKPSRSLLETLSWNAQKLLARRKGTFDPVLAILQRVDGELTSFEYACRAPDGIISDHELLSDLGAVIAEEAAARSAVKIGIAYYGSKVKKISRLEPPIETVSISVPGVVLEIHTADTHIQAFRELVERPDGNLLAAMTAPVEIFDGPYMHVLTKPQAMAAE
jgi:hypothetical protein